MGKSSCSIPVIVVEGLEEAVSSGTYTAISYLQESDHKDTKQEAHRKHSKKFWVKTSKH
jgi:hypothetical protein